MSDKYTYKKEFIDESWGKMSSILDNEMPTRRKAIFPFWVLFTIILIIGGISAAFVYSTDKVEIDTPDVPTHPIADIEDKNTIEQIESYSNSNNNEINHSIPLFKKPPIYAGSETKEIKIIPQITLTSKEIDSKNKFIVPINEIKPNAAVAIITEADVKNKTIYNISKLKPNNTPIPNSENELKEELASIDNIIAKNKKWRFGIGGGMKFKSKDEKGFFVSAGVKKEISPKWNINMEGEYFSMNASAEYDSFNKELTLSPEPSNLANSSLSSPIIYDKTKIQYHGFKIPIIASYEFHKNWELQMGVVSQILFENVRLSESNSDITSSFSQSSNEDMNKIHLTKFDPQLALGLAYHPTNNITTELRYEQGLRTRKFNNGETSYTAANQNYDQRFGGLSVGMKYYF